MSVSVVIKLPEMLDFAVCGLHDMREQPLLVAAGQALRYLILVNIRPQAASSTLRFKR